MVRLLGFLFLGLALLGVFLPLLPTTPFVLVAAACFAQSSEKMHKWILANRTFGPMVLLIQQVEADHDVFQRQSLIALFRFMSSLQVLN